MSKDGLAVLIKECLKRVPPKQSAYADYFQDLLKDSESNDVPHNKIAARLWLALFRPTVVPPLQATQWAFRLDDHVLGALQRLITHGLLGAGDAVDITETVDGETKVLSSFDIMAETMETLGREFDAHNSTSGMELKLIQLMLTATSQRRAISGPHFRLALSKLTEVFLYSKQMVNQNAARATITQIVTERMEDERPEQAEDKQVIMNWLCGVIIDPACPTALCLLALDMLVSTLKTRSQLFETEQPLGKIISGPLLQALIGPLNLGDEGIFERCLQILELILTKHLADNKEVVEIIATDYFGAPHAPSTDLTSPRTPLIKNHLRPFRNKMRTLELFSTHLLGNPTLMFTCFLNYDCDARMASIIEAALELVLVFSEVDWHRAEGSRITGSVFTDKDLALKLACVNLLQTFMASVLSWHDRSPECNETQICELLLASQARRATLQQCVHAFNERAQTGLDMAVKAGFVDSESPRNQVEWARFTRGISKSVLGDYLGAASRSALLAAYTDTFDFQGLTFVAALRMFLESFRIPGESQVIERLMEQFSRRLCEVMPSEFPDQELIFQVSYSTLMLNTDMYSANVRDKMNREAFVRNTLGAVAADKTVSTGMLEAIYDEIAAGEIQLYSQMVEHPLPLGSRRVLPFRNCTDGNGVAALLVAVSDLWARTLALCIDKFHIWPGQGAVPVDLFSDHVDFLAAQLDSAEDLVLLTCKLGLERERYCVLERLLATTAFRVDYNDQGNNPTGLAWLYNLCSGHGSQLGSSWAVVLACLSTWDLASIVDEHHNLQGLDLGLLDGEGLQSFTSALVSLKKTNQNKAFVSHYAKKLVELSSSQLERAIRHSYEREVPTTGASFFALLATAADDPFLTNAGFAVLHRVAREQMPLILALRNEAMFGYLRALERFALQKDSTMGSGAIDTLVLIGELLYSHHRSSREAPVEDEEFFLKWYHVLSGLSRIGAEHLQREVGRLAIQSLFRLLREQGACYQEGAWRVVWRSVIFPLLEEVRSGDAEEVELFVKLMDWSVELLSIHADRLMTDSLVDVFDSTKTCPFAYDS